MINVFFIEDDRLFSSTVSMMLSLSVQPKIQIVGIASSGEEALSWLAKGDDNVNNLDVILLDLELGTNMSGLDTARAILTIKPEVAILALTTHRAKYYLNQLLPIGINGYVNKRSSSAILIQAIVSLSEGKLWFPDDIYKKLALKKLKLNETVHRNKNL